MIPCRDISVEMICPTLYTLQSRCKLLSTIQWQYTLRCIALHQIPSNNNQIMLLKVHILEYVVDVYAINCSLLTILNNWYDLRMSKTEENGPLLDNYILDHWSWVDVESPTLIMGQYQRAYWGLQCMSFGWEMELWGSYIVEMHMPATNKCLKGTYTCNVNI